MKTQTLESFIKETEEEFEEKWEHLYRNCEMKLEADGVFSIDIGERFKQMFQSFLFTKLQQAGEVAVEEYKKKVKDIIPWKMIWNIEDGLDYREKLNGWNECVDYIQTKFNLLKEK